MTMIELSQPKYAVVLHDVIWEDAEYTDDLDEAREIALDWSVEQNGKEAYIWKYNENKDGYTILSSISA